MCVAAVFLLLLLLQSKYGYEKKGDDVSSVLRLAAMAGAAAAGQLEAARHTHQLWPLTGADFAVY
jgi:hypothetical protein